MCDLWLTRQIQLGLKNREITKLPDFHALLDDVFNALRAKGAAIGVEVDETFALTVAICALGPKQQPGKPPVGNPPVELCLKLYDLLTTHFPSEEWVDRSIQIVFAYSCGWGRSVVRGSSEWDGIWIKALFVMEKLISCYIRQANTAWAALGPGGVRDFRRPSEADVEHYAINITMLLIHNNAGMGYRVFHAAAGWNPSIMNFYAFLQRSVQGPLANLRQAGSVAQGMYFPLLKEDRILDKDNMLFKKCQEELPNGELCNRAFQGRQPCPMCGKPFNNQVSLLIARMMLYVPDVFNFTRMYHCHDCGNYCLTPGGPCPRDNAHNVSLQPTGILV